MSTFWQLPGDLCQSYEIGNYGLSRATWEHYSIFTLHNAITQSWEVFQALKRTKPLICNIKYYNLTKGNFEINEVSTEETLNQKKSSIVAFECQAT